MASQELTNLSINNSPKSAQDQLADIKKQASKVVNLARKQDPNIKVNVADAEKIGLKLDIPTQKREVTADPALSRVGSAPIPKTGFDTAKNAILDSVPEEDRDTIAQILDVSTGLQTERGSELETQLDDFSSQRMNLAESSAERKRERGDLLTQARLPEAEAELESIRAEGDVLSAKRNMAIQNESRRSGVSTTAQNLNIGAIEKDFSLQQANLAIRELASVGKINAATRLIDSKLDIKYGDIEAETELVKAQIEAILPLLSREDKKVAETRLLLNQQVQAKMTEARESDKALEEFKLQSYLFAQQNSASPAVLSNIMSAESREDVASVGGTAITDPSVDLQRRVHEANILQSEASARASDASTESKQTNDLIARAKIGDTEALTKLGITVDPETSQFTTVSSKDAAKLQKEMVANDNYKAVQKAQTSLIALEAYEKVFEEVGTTSGVTSPFDNARLTKVHKAALLDLKEFFNLGVLNGPDLEILTDILGDPTGQGFVTNISAKTGAVEGIKQIKAKISENLDDRFLSVMSQYGEYNPEDLPLIEDTQRVYIQTKAKVDSQVQSFIDENPNLSTSDVLQVINNKL